MNTPSRDQFGFSDNDYKYFLNGSGPYFKMDRQL